jgi:uncharacterized protein (TIGR00730 family)
MTNRSLKSVAVFCGSNFGGTDHYRLGAGALGRALAEAGITLVYGGTRNGLMGVVCDAALASGGTVHGVITEDLHRRGHIHPHLTQFEITPTLALRKERMVGLVDAFIALPGGIGTMDELLHVWAMSQLAEIDKPIGLLNTADFFSTFLTFIDDMVATRFLPPAHRNAVCVDADAEALIVKLRSYVRVDVGKTVGSG